MPGGPVRAALHCGSVDSILAAIERLQTGEVLVVDDAGPRDRACVGDLIALEAREAGAAALVVWGSHRDTEQLRDIGLPVFSVDCHPNGPLPGDPLDRARIEAQEPRLGDIPVEESDVVVADDDGVLIIPQDLYATAAEEADRIERMELSQAQEMWSGMNLRDQVRFHEYVDRRDREPGFTFREHIRILSRTIER